MSHDVRTARARRALPGLPPRLRRRDGGYVMVMTALAVVPLLILTAFAVDLGAWYAQSNKMQRTVDNAALAAVVWMPDHAKAQTAAQDVLTKNGYTGSFTITYPTEQRVRITINQGTQQFFSKIVMRAPTLGRSATAEFSKAVPLGSPANVFGNILDGSNQCGTGSTCSGIWGSINGPFTGHNQGDPYTTRCANTQGNFEPACSSTTNSDYKPGYVYAVDVPPSLVGQLITVDVFDAIASNSSVTGEGIGNSQPFRTQFQLYKSDGSDLTVSTDSSLAMTSTDCSGGGAGGFIAKSDSSSDQSTYLNKWAVLCTFRPTLSGIYPLYVKSSQITGFPTDQGSGSNSFAIRATKSGGGTQASVYAINDMSIYSPTANSPGNISRFYLASINDEYAGKTMIIDLFDPGDGSSGTFTMQFRAPPSGLGTIPNDAGAILPCQYNSVGSTTIGGGTLDATSNTCSIMTRSSSTGSIYDNRWLRVKISIPSTYTCTTDCWWTIKYNYGTGTSTDRTVWTVTLLGDPVHLVE